APIFAATGEKLGLVLVRVSAADLVTASNRQTVMALIWLLLVLGITLGLFLGVFYISGYFKLYKQYIALLASHNQASSEALAEVHSRAEHLAKYAAGLNQLGVDGDPSKRQAYITAVEQEVAGLQVACAELKGTGKEAPGHE
ncbi:MAG: hypothetical protein WCG94_04870, partial [Methanothrix sp.]